MRQLVAGPQNSGNSARSRWSSCVSQVAAMFRSAGVTPGREGSVRSMTHTARPMPIGTERRRRRGDDKRGCVRFGAQGPARRRAPLAYRLGRGGVPSALGRTARPAAASRTTRGRARAPRRRRVHRKEPWLSVSKRSPSGSGGALRLDEPQPPRKRHSASTLNGPPRICRESAGHDLTPIGRRRALAAAARACGELGREVKKERGAEPRRLDEREA
jgi:hypothetical protein